MQSVLWMMVGALFTFEGMWLSHDPTALHSLGAWGYDPTAETLAATGKAVTSFGGISMALIGCGLHILPSYWAQDLRVKEMEPWSHSFTLAEFRH